LAAKIKKLLAKIIANIGQGFETAKTTEKKTISVRKLYK